MASCKILLPSKVWRVFLGARRTKFQSTKVRDPHFPRKRMLEVCKPMFDIPDYPAWETCTKNVILPAVNSPHPYEKILSDELTTNWNASRMICLFHVNPLKNRDYTKVRNIFFKEDFFFHLYSEPVARLALENTRFSSCLHLYSAPTGLVFSAEPRASKLLSISNKLTNVILLAAFVDGAFFSKNQLVDYSKLPDKEILHQQLSYLLNSKVASVVSTMSQPSQLLSQYLKQLNSPESENEE